MTEIRQGRYFDRFYDKKKRFAGYWHQIDEIISLKPDVVLEVGIGNGFVSEYLKKRKINIKTLDLDEKLSPDIVGNVLSIPFEAGAFDVVACYEILEHLPYEDFRKALSEIFRVSRSYAILSLPDLVRAYRMLLDLPKIGEIKKVFQIPKIRKIEHKFDGLHYWEIGKAGYPLKRISDDIRSAGFEIKKTYRVFEDPYYRFFVLKKKK